MSSLKWVMIFGIIVLMDICDMRVSAKNVATKLGLHTRQTQMYHIELTRNIMNHIKIKSFLIITEDEKRSDMILYRVQLEEELKSYE